MALNIFPRRRDAAPELLAAPLPESLPEPSAEALAQAEESKRPARRSRSTRAARETAAAVEAATPADGEAPGEPAPPPRARRTRAPKPELEAGVESPAPVAVEAGPEADSVTESAEGHTPSRRRRGGRGRGGSAALAAQPAEDGEIGGSSTLPAGQADLAALIRTLDRHTRQIEQLIKAQEDLLRRGGGPVAGAVGQRPRVGIFVDVANVELASDRLRARFDWGKILALLTSGRELIRAMAYSPVHDDPQVSIETQRFVEPFLDRGYKIVTKPLKRFQDGTIKANVDIELALDVMAMLDRLDIVCLVSGDGDFQRLVEDVQARGVQVEVVSVAQSTATNLRHAADRFIDLGARLREVRA